MMAGLVVVAVAAGAAIVAWRAESEGGSSPFDENYPTANTISCASATSCLAVGSAERGTPRTSVPVAQAFDAGTWRTVAVRSPGKPGSRTTLTGVSCPAAGYCLAVGEYDPADRGLPRPYAMSWDGASLSPAVRLPLPTASDLEELGGVSCPAVNRCAVTGNVPRGEIIWTWNGRTWKLTAWRGPKAGDYAELSAVSCRTANDCVAVGSDGPDTGQRAAALTWDGAHWKAARVPGPGPGKMSVFYSVSCAKTGGCTAIGEQGAAGVTIIDLTDPAPLAVRQVGGAWQLVAIPDG